MFVSLKGLFMSTSFVVCHILELFVDHRTKTTILDIKTSTIDTETRYSKDLHTNIVIPKDYMTVTY